MLAVIIVAAGSGTRMGGSKKQYIPLGGKPLFMWSAQAFLACAPVQELILVLPEADRTEVAERWLMELRSCRLDCRLETVAGGKTRQASVAAGLAALQSNCPYVIVHDAARPMIKKDLILQVFAAAEECGAATAAVPVKDTIKRSTDGKYFTQALERHELWQVQTPQCFRRDWIVQAHAQGDPAATDDTVMVEALGHRVKIVPGDYANFKVTTWEDMARARALLEEEKGMLRIGQGWDLHRIEMNRRLVLGGVEIPWDRGLAGHSDADVLIHAVIDALLGGAALGNIGKLFPDTDPAFYQADSSVLLQQTVELLNRHGFWVVNVDATILAEAPRLASYLPLMQSGLAAVLQLDEGQISVKAKTGEGVGTVGRGEGMAAQAVCLLRCREGVDLTKALEMPYP